MERTEEGFITTVIYLKGDIQMKVFMKKEKMGVDAIGTYDPQSKKCVVLKGSKVSETISKAPTFRGAKSVVKHREGIVKNYIVTKDIAFKSCSTAGNFVTGRSTDGFGAWKVEDGRTLREFLSPDK